MPHQFPHQFLEETISHHVGKVTLQSQPANVLSQSVLKELDQVFRELEEDEYVRVAVLTGSGRFFCAGADIKELAEVSTAHRGTEFASHGQVLLNRIERLDKPVIAAINGTCVGGGLELALACHMRVAAAGVALGLPEIKLGLIPGFGGTLRLPRIIGASQAAELILTGELITAEQALVLGLVNRVVPAQDLLQETMAIAAKIAEKGRLAVRAAMRAIRSGLDRPLAQGLVREAELFGGVCETPDKKEGIQAFLEKREPKFADPEPQVRRSGS